MGESLESQVKQALDTATTQWASIDDLLAHVAGQIEVPEEFSRTAVQDRLKKVIRRQLKARRDADGLAQWESIERPGEGGEAEKVYKQLAMFDRDDYRITIDYYAQAGTYNLRKANTLAQRCNRTLKTRLPLPFPQFGCLKDGEESAA